MKIFLLHAYLGIKKHVYACVNMHPLALIINSIAISFKKDRYVREYA